MPSYSSNFNILDIEFTSGHRLNLSFVVSSEQELDAETAILDTDGFIHFKREPSYAPVTIGDRISDVAFYSKEGEVLETQHEVTGTIFAHHAYHYAVEAPPKGLPSSGISMA